MEPIVEDLELIDSRFAVVFKVNTSKNEEAIGAATGTTSIKGETVGPSGAGHLAIHCKGGPLLSLDIEETDVIESYVLSVCIY